MYFASTNLLKNISAQETTYQIRPHPKDPPKKCRQLTADNVQSESRTERYQTMSRFLALGFQILDETLALLLRYVQILFQDIEMKSRRQNFSALVPFLPCTREKASSQPGMQILIHKAFLDRFLTREQNLKSVICMLMAFLFSCS